MVFNSLNRGQLYADENVNQSGFARTLACDCDPKPTCRDKAVKTIVAAGTISGFTLQDIFRSFPAPIVVTDVTAIRAAILAIVKNVENNAFVDVSYAAGALTVEHHGVGVLSSITTSTGVQMTTRQCERESLRYSQKSMQGGGIVLKWHIGTNGAVTFGTLPGTYVSGSATGAADLRADIIAFLGALVSPTGTVRDVIVTDDVIAGQFNVAVQHVSGFYIYLDASKFKTSGGTVQFKA